VGTDELARLFGFAKPLPPKYFEIEKFSGVDQVPNAHIYLAPGSPTPSTKSSDPRQNRPGMSPGGLQGPNQRPGGMPAGGAPGGGGGERRRQQPPAGAQPGGNRQASLGGSALLSADLGLTASRWQLASAASDDSDVATPGRQHARATDSGSSYLAMFGGESDYDTGLSTSNWRRGEATGTTGMSTSNWRRTSEATGDTGLATSGWRRVVSEGSSSNMPGMGNFNRGGANRGGANRGGPNFSGFQGNRGGGLGGPGGPGGGFGSAGMGLPSSARDCPACRGRR
jgi:hypothetical protein